MFTVEYNCCRILCYEYYGSSRTLSSNICLAIGFEFDHLLPVFTDSNNVIKLLNKPGYSPGKYVNGSSNFSTSFDNVGDSPIMNETLGVMDDRGLKTEPQPSS
jgi:hypothetical protein